jgi:hypothetical protein
MKYCQGPKCHQYKTKDRIRGPKGAKYYQTRRRSQLMYDSFCSQRCADDWFVKFGQRAVDHFGRIHEPIKLTEENAWYKFRDWRGDSNDRYFFANDLLGERRPITEQQYNDTDLVRP